MGACGALDQNRKIAQTLLSMYGSSETELVGVLD